ncbi:MAG: LOG family protein [Phycisphaerales bacterium]
MEEITPAETVSPTSPEVRDAIDRLARQTGVDPETLEGRQVVQMMQTVLRLMPDGRHAGELKLLNSALKELRYAYKVFAEYADTPKISIFGSARTPPDHPDYQAAVEFSRLLEAIGWMVITGAGDGIMRAGHEGIGRTASFGVAIRLPFETTANDIIAGDDKLIHFRYFFTRKVTFVSQSHAVALFPGGFGTQDENFEALTLIQTGKSHPVPIVMLEGGPDGAQTENGYWRHWDEYVRTQLLEKGWISPEDTSLYHLAKTPAEAIEHITKFYRNYHSSRYVADQYVIRMRHALHATDVERLNDEFGDLVESGAIVQRDAFEQEGSHTELPRLAFHHTRRGWGRVRQLIDAINECEVDRSE